nr:MAG TPA: Protein of unknown function (DUF1642) [Caudoviricetes sp.]
MNKQELIEYCESLKGNLNKFINGVDVDKIIANIEQLDEPQPIKLEDVIVRIKQLDIGTRKVWLDEFLNKLGSDYGLLKYKAGYEQGKFEGAWVGEQLKDADKIRRELNRPVVPHFVADWIELCKKSTRSLQGAMHYAKGTDVERWLIPSDNQETFARAWLDGYEVEKEKRYLVKMKGVTECGCYLNKILSSEEYFFASGSAESGYRTKFTRKELEDAGFGWVFDCEGTEVEEVQE